jgi:hypothetical protein
MMAVTFSESAAKSTHSVRFSNQGLNLILSSISSSKPDLISSNFQSRR